MKPLAYAAIGTALIVAGATLTAFAIVFAVGGLPSGTAERGASAHTIGPSSAFEIAFSPKGGCTNLAVREIGKAKKEILVQAYSYTSEPIEAALVAAHRRGVDVRIIADKSQTDERSQVDEAVAAGIPVRIDRKHAIAHNKVMVIDGKTVLTGSFNWTKAAEESNAENLLVIRAAAVASEYRNNWAVHADHSDPYEAHH